MSEGRKILITGGVRSGKSRFALSLAKASAQPKIFLATAQLFDSEMAKRIECHQKERDGKFSTVEEPLYLSKAVDGLLANSVVIIDCLTLWLNNLLFHFKDDEKRIQEQIALFIKSFRSSPANIIIVTNETGWGIMPVNELSRQYIEKAGALNQEIAAISDEVVLMVSGVPLWAKGKTNEQ